MRLVEPLADSIQQKCAVFGVGPLLNPQFTTDPFHLRPQQWHRHSFQGIGVLCERLVLLRIPVDLAKIASINMFSNSTARRNDQLSLFPVFLYSSPNCPRLSFYLPTYTLIPRLRGGVMTKKILYSPTDQSSCAEVLRDLIFRLEPSSINIPG